MKIISWNCNMAFRKKYEKVIQLKPDLLLIQECENVVRLKTALDSFDYNEIIWHGDNPHKGIAAISFNKVHIELKSDYNDEFQYVIPLNLKVNGLKIHLYHLWAMPHKSDRKKDYVGQIWGALEYYKDTLSQGSIWIGDFNSNAIWDKKNRIGNHSDVVHLLNCHHIHSLYHKQTEEEHGKESQPTLYLLKKTGKPYHMDYCFVSEILMTSKTKISIGKHKDWIAHSDHMPVIVDYICQYS